MQVVELSDKKVRVREINSKKYKKLVDIFYLEVKPFKNKFKRKSSYIKNNKEGILVDVIFDNEIYIIIDSIKYKLMDDRILNDYWGVWKDEE